MTRTMTSLFISICTAMLLASASIANAASISFDVSFNTAALEAAPLNTLGPYWVNFQLNSGNPGTTTAEISSFDFGGGSATATTEEYIGGASGSLSHSVLLSDSVDFYNDFIQQFTPGNSLRFRVTLTGPVSSAPDGLFFKILQGTMPVEIPTNGIGDALLVSSIGSPVAFETFRGVGAFADVAAIPTPEPMSLVLLGSGLLGVGAVRRRRRDRSEP